MASVEEAQSATVFINIEGAYVYPEEEGEFAATGSGFLIDPAGIAVTNDHVVTGMATLRAYIGGATDDRFNARVIGVAPCSDLAVIELDGEDFSYFEWYENEVTEGLDVWSLGYPLADPSDPEYVVTDGSVVEANIPYEHQWASVGSAIVHTATTHPGNSGGPLVAEDGRVVGVNYGGNPDLNRNLAVSVDRGRRIIARLQEGESLHSIGINGLGYRSEDGSLSGIWVVSVASGSPASRTGVQPGDIIVKMEGLSLGRDGLITEYCQILRSRYSDDVLAIQVLRLETVETLIGEINGRELEPIAAETLIEEPSEEPDVETGYSQYQTIVDETELIQVDVPVEWGDVAGDPLDVGPYLRAAPDLREFHQGFDTPGVEILASSTLKLEPDSILDQLVDADCTDLGRGSFEDERYGYQYQELGRCGGTETSLINIVGVAVDRSYVVVIQMRLVTEQDIEAVHTILSSFQVR
ncbi:peptidase S1 family protein [Natronococcus amylolyticus DSM 10524]|uniref:Peptidase S1 family protein n=1 Tax=Natronococcus amylolyticus DSM 10524 TaxID=1227497 RepID=L9X2D0_9EURY|nr:peptidase S1 family protein [Natronococcus amylolyticus DSM 10524]